MGSDTWNVYGANHNVNQLFVFE